MRQIFKNTIIFSLIHLPSHLKASYLKSTVYPLRKANMKILTDGLMRIDNVRNRAVIKKQKQTNFKGSLPFQSNKAIQTNV